MKLFCLSIALFIGFCNFAQDDLSQTVKWGELFALGKKGVAPVVIGQDGSSIYLIRTIKKKKYLEKYKMSSLRLEKSVLLELEYNGKDLTRMDQFMFGDAPSFYTNFYNKKLKKSFFFLHEVNPTTLKVSGPKKVSERDVEPRKKLSLANGYYNRLNARYGSTMIRSESGELGLFFSPKHAAGLSKTKNADQKMNKYHIALYDDEFEMQAEQDITLPYERFSVMQRRLGDDGTFYLLGYEYDVEESQKLLSKRKVISAGDMHVIVIDPESGEMESVDVELEDSEIEMIKLKLLSNGNFLLTGLTSTTETGVNGSFNIIFNENFEEISNNSNDFPDNFITQTWSEKKKKKLDKKNKKEDKKGKKKSVPVFYNYYIDHVVENPDGSTVMLAEQYYVRVVTHTYTTANGGTRTVTTYYYYYNDIIAVKYDKNGDHVWNTLIKKHQVSVNDGGYYSSYFVIQKGNEINIVYNDKESTVTDTDNMSYSDKKKARKTYVGIQVTLDEDGEQSKGKLFEFPEEEKLRLVPKVCADVKGGVAFVYAKGKKGDKLGTITVE